MKASRFMLHGLALLLLWASANGVLVKDSLPDVTTLNQDLTIFIDPPEGHSSPAALGVFVRPSDPDAIVYYDEQGDDPELSGDNALTYNSPYLQLDTPFKASRNRTISFIARLKITTEVLGVNVITYEISEKVIRHFFVEGSARALSYGHLVPGVESGGYFVSFGLEMAATARAQVAGGQEFADFNTTLGIGTYLHQVEALNLTGIDRDLTGFEGGFPGAYPLVTNMTFNIWSLFLQGVSFLFAQ